MDLRLPVSQARCDDRLATAGMADARLAPGAALAAAKARGVQVKAAKQAAADATRAGTGGEQQQEEKKCEGEEVQKKHALRLAFAARRRRLVDDATEVGPRGLFVGGIGACRALVARGRGRAVAGGAGISHILTISKTAAVSPDRAAADKAGFHCLTLAVHDRPGASLSAHFGEAFAFIEAGRRAGGVLVHCFQGKSRSVSIVLAYQMWERRRQRQQLASQQPSAPALPPPLTFLGALEAVRAVRPAAAPNAGFAAELMAFERAGCELLLPGQLSTTAGAGANEAAKDQAESGESGESNDDGADADADVGDTDGNEVSGSSSSDDDGHGGDPGFGIGSADRVASINPEEWDVLSVLKALGQEEAKQQQKGEKKEVEAAAGAAVEGQTAAESATVAATAGIGGNGAAAAMTVPATHPDPPRSIARDIVGTGEGWMMLREGEGEAGEGPARLNDGMLFGSDCGGEGSADDGLSDGEAAWTLDPSRRAGLEAAVVSRSGGARFVLGASLSSRWDADMVEPKDEAAVDEKGAEVR